MSIALAIIAIGIFLLGAWVGWRVAVVILMRQPR